MSRLTAMMIAVAILTGALALRGEGIPGTDPRGTGAIVDISVSDGLVTAILVYDQQASRLGQPDLFWITVDSNTRIITVQDGRAETAGPSDLSPGQQVASWFAGPVYLSYPGRGHAAALCIVQ